jgi:GNAT superfamily N-acetyltransferase
VPTLEIVHVEIRYAVGGDAEALHKLIQAAFAEYEAVLPVPPGALGDTLEHARSAIADGRTLLACDGGQIMGTARYEPRDGYMYVGRVAVHPDYRRRGVGIELMGYVEQVARDLGYTRLRLGTRQSMPGNLAFIEGLGYSIAEREQHPRGPDINVWFEKELEPQGDPIPVILTPDPKSR